MKKISIKKEAIKLTALALATPIWSMGIAVVWHKFQLPVDALFFIIGALFSVFIIGFLMD